MGAGSSAGLPFSASTIDIYSSLPEKLTKEQCIEVVGKQSTDRLWSQFMNTSCGSCADHDHGGSSGGRGSSECIRRERLLTLSTTGTLNQKKERSYKHTLPKIHFLNYKYFKAAGSFPRFDSSSPELLTEDQINHSKVFIIFISHAWLCDAQRGTQQGEAVDGIPAYSQQEECYQRGEFPYPDTVKNAKYQLCIEGIEWIRHNHIKDMEECFIWLDYSCLNQDVNPVLEVEELDVIMACCDCVFTPIVDDDTSHQISSTLGRGRVEMSTAATEQEAQSSQGLAAANQASIEWDLVPEKSSGITSLTKYQAEAWVTHLSRAWTRLEMVSSRI